MADGSADAVGAADPVGPTGRTRPAEPTATGSGAAGPAVAPFVGRRRELDVLRDLVAASATGHGCLAMVAGEAGIGKTRLTEAVLESAAPRPRGTGRCRPDDQRPFEVVRRALRSAAETPGAATDAVEALRAAASATVAADDLGSTHADERLRTYERIRQCLAALPIGCGLLLVLEDLHWSDPSSAGLLGWLGPELPGLGVTIVGTYRPEEVGDDHPVRPVIDLGSADVHLLALGALGPQDVVTVAAAYAGLDPAGLDAPALHAATGGNPLFARELARLHGASLGDGARTVPASVRAVIARRLDRLDPGSRPVLDALAVAGAAATTSRLATLVDVGVPEVLDRLTAHDRAGLVVAGPAPDRWSFTHALIGQAVYEALSGSARAGLHLRCAEVLEAEGAPPRAVAHHLAGALPLIDSARAGWASRRAGEVALAEMAYEEAARHLADADARAAHTDEADRTDLLLALGEARYRAGERAGADAAFAGAAALARGTGRSDQLAGAALGFGGGSGGFEVVPYDDDQAETLADALAALGEGDAAGRARLLARRSVATSTSTSVEDQRATADEALALARDVDDPGLLAYALSAHCDAHAGPDDIDERMRAAGEMLALSARARDREAELLARRLRIEAHLEAGDAASAQADIDAFSRVADRLGDPLFRWYGPFFRASLAAAGGRFDEAEALHREARALGRRAGSFNAELLAEVQQGGFRLLQGRYRDALAQFQIYLDRFPNLMADVPGGSLVTLIHLLAGERESHRSWYDRARATGFAVRYDSEWLPATCYALATAVLLDDREAAADLRARLLPHRHRFVVDGIGATLLGAAGGWTAPASAHLGLAAEAERELADAVAADRQAGCTVMAERLVRIGVPWSTDAASLPAPAAPPGPPPRTPAPRAAVLHRAGDHWTATFAGTTATVRDSKGLRDLATLLARPGREVASVDLVVPDARPDQQAVDRGADEVLDAPARAAYRARIVDLQAELDDADGAGDASRSATAQAELDLLAAELAAATGLGGRARRTGSDVERARKAVAARIRDCLRRLEPVHPDLARHLRHSVRTGTYCAYAPETPVSWDVRS